MKNQHFEIIDNEVTLTSVNHPLLNRKNKSEFVKLLMEDLEICQWKNFTEKEDLFFFSDNFIRYNLFVEHVDGGGRDLPNSKNPNKKIALPQNKSFLQLIDDFSRVLIVDIYVPLINDGKDLDYENRVYLFLEPNEIYKYYSKIKKKMVSLNKNHLNSSSRWATLEDIKNAMNNNLIIENKKKNVFIVNRKLVKTFFDSKVKELYANMLEDEYNDFTKLEDFEGKENIKDNKFRRLFRRKLIEKYGTKCRVQKCNIDIEDIMVSSHLRPVYDIKNDNKIDNLEKIRQIKDPNNGLILCPNHDSLIDKFHITLQTNGLIKSVSKVVEDYMEEFGLDINDVLVGNLSPESARYIEMHNKLFKETQK